METSLHEIRFSGVEFAYETMSAPLLRDLTLHLPLGWTGVVGANGSGKTTLLKLAVGAYRPVVGSVQGPEESVYCAQRTDDPPPLLGPLLAAMDGAAWDIKGRLGLEADWIERWESLSHGERKRAQIAVALWLEPPVLAVDEPTNHIDAQARTLKHPDLVMRPDDRVALSGPNGGGKSTLVRHLLRRLNIEAARLVYMPQEINAGQAREILAEVRSLPRTELGRMMTAVSRLGSRPHRLLESAEPSPGEIRKILLALGIARVPHLIIMDEPTNHLDLPSIECLEEALDGCPCGLLLVSHDERFLARLTTTRWRIASDGWDARLEVVA